MLPAARLDPARSTSTAQENADDDHHPERPPPRREAPTREAAASLAGVETDAPGRVAAAAGEPATGITGAQSLVRSLEAVGVEVVFGIPGGAILPLYDPLFDSTVRHVLVRHEQGAGHAATGYAQATGRVGVCMATSGPGRDQPGDPAGRRATWTPCRSWRSPARCPAARSAPTPSRRPTSAASRCR